MIPATMMIRPLQVTHRIVFFPLTKPIPFLIPRRHRRYLPVQIEFAYYNTTRCVDLTMHEIVLDSKKKNINILQLTRRKKKEENFK